MREQERKNGGYTHCDYTDCAALTKLQTCCKRFCPNAFSKIS